MSNRLCSLLTHTINCIPFTLHSGLFPGWPGTPRHQKRAGKNGCCYTPEATIYTILIYISYSSSWKTLFFMNLKNMCTWSHWSITTNMQKSEPIKTWVIFFHRVTYLNHRLVPYLPHLHSQFHKRKKNSRPPRPPHIAQDHVLGAFLGEATAGINKSKW